MSLEEILHVKLMSNTKFLAVESTLKIKKENVDNADSFR